jgi:hypothetical protein
LGARSPELPCVGHELAEALAIDPRQPHEDGRVAVIVGLSKEHVGIFGEQQLLVNVIADPHRDDLGIGNTGLLRVLALLPEPDELLVVHEEAEGRAVFARVVERERHPAYVLARRYGALVTTRRR